MGISYTQFPEAEQGQLYYPGDRVVFKNVNPHNAQGRLVHTGDRATVVSYWPQRYSYTIELDIPRHKNDLRLNVSYWSIEPETDTLF